MNRFVLMPAMTAEGAWRVATGSESEVSIAVVNAPSNLEGMARSLKEHLQTNGYAGEGTLLAVPSSWCLCAQLSTESLPRQKRYETLLYRLEERLPIPAETFVADFVRHTQGATGICLQLDQVDPVIKALEGQGIAIEAIIPAALLTVQRSAPSDADAVLWEHNGKVDVFLLDKQLPVGWYLLPPADVQAPLALTADTLKRPLKVVAYGVSAGTRRLLEQMPNAVAEFQDGSFEENAASEGLAALDGQFSPWINLRRHALAPPHAMRAVKRPLIAAIAAVVFLCLAAGLTLLLRASHYQSVAAAIVARQEAVFHQALPTQTTPLNVRSRLSSELEKLNDLHRGSSGTDQADSASSLVLLRDAVGHIPSDLRIRLTELQITPDHFYAEGQAANHSDAERLAKALDQMHQWSIESPRTEQSPGGSVTFTISGGALASSRSSAP